MNILNTILSINIQLSIQPIIFYKFSISISSYHSTISIYHLLCSHRSIKFVYFGYLYQLQKYKKKNNNRLNFLFQWTFNTHEMNKDFSSSEGCELFYSRSVVEREIPQCVVNIVSRETLFALLFIGWIR